MMKRYILRLCAVLALAIAASACGNSERKAFDKLLVELANADQTIDQDDWKRICDYLDGNKAHFGEFFDGGELSQNAVEEYIRGFFERRRPSKEISFSGLAGQELQFHIYLEQSGSMKAYDSPNGDGSFHAAVMSLQNSLPGTAVVEAIGEQGYTDFKAIFDNVLNKTKSNQVSILVTDMIYSVKDMQGVNAQKVFSEAQGMINAVFKAEVEHKSMLIVKLRGSYNGSYYAYDNSVHPYNGFRPYYIIVVGGNDAIARLTTDKALHAFADFQSLRGYENMYLYQAKPLYRPYYSLLLAGDDIRGRFQPERGSDDRVVSIDGMEPDRDSGDIQLALAVNLGGMLIDNGYLCDVGNYRVEADDNVKIRQIRPITQKDRTPAERKYTEKATHIFVLSMEKVTHKQTVRISLLNRLPQWVAQSSTDSDLRVDDTTTFGLRYLLEGIYDSYKRMSEGEPKYFDMELKFND